MAQEQELDLTALVGQADRDLLVTGLQALWRERVLAMHASNRFRGMHGLPALDSSEFGMDEVNAMLRRVGAAASLTF